MDRSWLYRLCVEKASELRTVSKDFYIGEEFKDVLGDEYILQFTVAT